LHASVNILWADAYVYITWSESHEYWWWAPVSASKKIMRAALRRLIVAQGGAYVNV